MKAKTYKLEPKTLRTIVDRATTGINSMTGKAYGSEADRALIGFARKLGMLPPSEFYGPIRTAGRQVPQIEATSKLASDPGPDEIRRTEIASNGPKTI